MTYFEPVLVRRFTLTLAGLALAACPRAPEQRSGTDQGGECRVRVTDIGSDIEPPDPLPPQRSRIGVAVHAELGALERALAGQVPVTLAAERRKPVGAPGEVSYVVRRGRFGIGLDSERLTVRVPVEIEAEVCKPLGPFCPTYGRCSPRLAAVASVPLLLDEGYSIGKSRVAISVTRPCTIAGYDATPEIRRQAHHQIGSVQGRIDQAMPEIRPSVAGVWELLHHPIALGASTCLHIAPDRIAQRRPKLDKTALVSELDAEGTLSIEDPCEAKQPVRVPPLPRLITSEEPSKGIELRVPVRVGWVDVSAELTRSLTRPETARAPTRVAKLEARGARGKVALRATLAGAACGDVRLLAEPWFDARTLRIRLRNVGPAPKSPGLADLPEVTSQIERWASASLPVDIASGPAALSALVRGFGKDLPEGVEIDTAIEKPAVEVVHPEKEGLTALAIFSGHTTFRLR